MKNRSDNSNGYFLGYIKYDSKTRNVSAPSMYSYEDIVLMHMIEIGNSFQHEGDFFKYIANDVYRLINDIKRKNIKALNYLRRFNITFDAVLLSIYDELAISYETNLTMYDIKNYIARVYLKQLGKMYLEEIRITVPNIPEESAKRLVRHAIMLWLNKTNQQALNDKIEALKFHLGSDNIIKIFNGEIDDILDIAMNLEEISAEEIKKQTNYFRKILFTNIMETPKTFEEISTEYFGMLSDNGLAKIDLDTNIVKLGVTNAIGLTNVNELTINHLKKFFIQTIFRYISGILYVRLQEKMSETDAKKKSFEIINDWLQEKNVELPDVLSLLVEKIDLKEVINLFGNLEQVLTLFKTEFDAHVKTKEERLESNIKSDFYDNSHLHLKKGIFINTITKETIKELSETGKYGILTIEEVYEIIRKKLALPENIIIEYKHIKEYITKIMLEELMQLYFYELIQIIKDRNNLDEILEEKIKKMLNSLLYFWLTSKQVPYKKGLKIKQIEHGIDCVYATSLYGGNETLISTLTNGLNIKLLFEEYKLSFKKTIPEQQSIEVPVVDNLSPLDLCKNYILNAINNQELSNLSYDEKLDMLVVTFQREIQTNEKLLMYICGEYGLKNKNEITKEHLKDLLIRTLINELAVELIKNKMSESIEIKPEQIIYELIELLKANNGRLPKLHNTNTSEKVSEDEINRRITELEGIIELEVQKALEQNQNRNLF